MPIYEYQCGSCDHQFETMQRMSEAPLNECPECGVDSLKKLISPVAFRLKGGGWYETDFKKGGARNVAKSETSGEKDSKATEAKDSKKDSKDAGAKKESKSEKSSTTTKESSSTAK